MRSRVAALGLLGWLFCLLATPAPAGQLDRAMLEKEFPAPLMVGQKDDALPIWPILKQNGGAIEVFAYAFESADFAAINGFGGEPVDMLVALGPDGSFKDVKVLSQHEPVFVDGLGPEPLFNFVQQYIGLSARHTLRVGRPNARSNGASPLNVVDGVAMATASTRVINESLLGSALAVARKKLGFGAASTVGLRVIAKDDTFEKLTWADLLKRGWVKDLRLTNGEVDKAFADSNVPPEGADKPNDVFSQTYVAYLNVPSIGRNLLGDKLYKNVMGWLGPGDHAILVVAAGPWSPLGDDFVLGSIPDRVQVVQDRLAINARDLAIERTPGDGMAGMPDGQWTILKVVEEGGFDPSKPWQLTEKVTRERGQILAEKVTREFTDRYSLPDALFKREKPDTGPTWVDSWRARIWELVALGAMLAVLVPVLIRQKGLVADQKRFTPFRIAYLAFTLGFIGWYAQAQLSIVTLVGLVRNARSGDITFLLYDPPSLMLWAFVLVTLLIWGRGTFCGWLCPFGALQELVALPAKWLRIPQMSVPPRVDRVFAQRQIRCPRRNSRRRRGVDAPVRHLGRGRTVQDVDHAVLHPILAVRRLRDRAARPEPVRLQGILPLSVPARREPGAGRPRASLQLDSAPCRMRHAVPALQGEVPLRRHRAERRDQLSRMLPVHGLRDDHQRSDALRAADHRTQAGAGHRAPPGCRGVRP